MAKARTYNLNRNGGQKQETDKDTSMMLAKADLITFNSSKHQDWDDASETGGNRKDSFLSPFVLTIPSNPLEHDFDDVDEFMDSQSRRHTLCVQKIGLFEER